MEPAVPSGHWTFHAAAPIEEVAIALLQAGIEYETLSQTASLRPGASAGREETPHDEDFDFQDTVIYHQNWTQHNRPTMPVDGEWVFEEAQDWSEAWREGIEPIQIGPVHIVPPWLDDQTVVIPDEIRLLIDPGQAFGTGHHETTSHCVQALIDADLAGKRVVDIGTGTGILAIIAAARGAKEVVAVDTDPVAIDIAKALIEDHQPRLFSTTEVHCVEGSADGVVTPPTFDVVVANMISPILMAVANDLARLLSPEGVLIMSGISNERAVEVSEAFATHGITLSITPGIEWALALGRHTR